jgi:hypothetical protein
MSSASNLEWVKSIFERIPLLEISLEDDATILPPDYLREKLYQCRQYLNEVNRYIQTTKHSLWEITRALDATQAEYSLSLDEMLATNESVRRGASHKDRVAIANQILIDRIKNINDLGEEKRDLEALNEVLMVKLRDLNSVNSDIRVAKQLLKSEIHSGGFYGNESEKTGKDHSLNAAVLLHETSPIPIPIFNPIPVQKVVDVSDIVLPEVKEPEPKGLSHMCVDMPVRDLLVDSSTGKELVVADSEGSPVQDANDLALINFADVIANL